MFLPSAPLPCIVHLSHRLLVRPVVLLRCHVPAGHSHARLHMRRLQQACLRWLLLLLLRLLLLLLRVLCLRLLL